MIKPIEQAKDHSVSVSQPPSQASAYYAHNQALLNDMYHRAKHQDLPSSDNSHVEPSGPLLNYISIKEPHRQGSKSKIKEKNKQRLKTDMCSVENTEETSQLKLENQALRTLLNKQEKRVRLLQSFQSEVQYLRKICLIQATQIEKLRKVVRQGPPVNRQQAFSTEDEPTLELKSAGKAHHILICDRQSKVTQAKNKKCSHRCGQFEGRSSLISQQDGGRKRSVLKEMRDSELQLRKTVGSKKSSKCREKLGF